MQTHTYQKTAEVFGVSINALITWEKKLERTGSLEDIPRKNVCPKIDPKELQEYVEKHPDHYQWKIAQHFGCTQQEIWSALKKLKITRKKRVFDTKSKTQKK